MVLFAMSITDLSIDFDSLFKMIKVNQKERGKNPPKKSGFESSSNIFLVGCFRSCCTASGMIRGLCWHFVSHSAVNGVLLDWNNRIVS